MRLDLFPRYQPLTSAKRVCPQAHCMKMGEVKPEKRETARGSLLGFLLRSLVYVARRGLIQPNLEGVTLQWLYLGELKVYEA